MTGRLLDVLRDLALSAFAVAAGTLALVEEITQLLGLVSVLLGIVGALYTIIERHRALRSHRAPGRSAARPVARRRWPGRRARRDEG